MNFWILNSRRAGQNGIDPFHLIMFHGQCFRGGIAKPYGYCASYRELREPLRVYKNLFNLSKVIIPDRIARLVASAQVAKILPVTPSVQLIGVCFERVFVYPFEPYDRSYYDKLPNFVDGSEVAFNLPDRNDLISEIEPYCELVVPRYQDLVDRYRDTTLIKLKVGSSFTDDDMIAKISAKMLNENSVIWHSCGFICSDAIYAALAPYVDETYFEWTMGKL